MSEHKRGRGRPKGASRHADTDWGLLQTVAEAIALDPTLKATTAIRNRGVTDEAALRRLQRRWKEDGDKLLRQAGRSKPHAGDRAAPRPKVVAKKPPVHAEKPADQKTDPRPGALARREASDETRRTNSSPPPPLETPLEAAPQSEGLIDPPGSEALVERPDVLTRAAEPATASPPPDTPPEAIVQVEGANRPPVSEPAAANAAAKTCKPVPASATGPLDPFGRAFDEWRRVTEAAYRSIGRNMDAALAFQRSFQDFWTKR